MEISNNVGFIYVADEKMSQNPCLDVMMSDLTKLPNCQKITEREDKNLVRLLLKKQKIQRLTKGKLNFILKKHYELDWALREACSKYKMVYVLFLNNSFENARYPADVLVQYRKCYGNVKFILFFIDTVVFPLCHDAARLLKSGVMDLTYSFDKKDAAEYGMKHWHSPYSKIPLSGQAKEYNLYLCCDAYTRRNEILQMVEACKTNRIEYYFHLRCKDSQTTEIFRNIDSGVEMFENSWLPYQQVLQESLAANCILEIIKPGQAGLTLRSYEAVCYNRKLLTNNKAILDFEFYDPRFMRYFEKVENIDWNWVKEDIPVDYRYDGRFSPVYLLKDIVESDENNR